jgi:arylsulfatase A-like enzyme/predicted Zn-dependent protease
MTRRRTTASAVIAVSLLLAACGRGGERANDQARAAPGAPSLLLITLDTTRADHLGPYGGPAAATPNLAALARDGALFEHVWAVAPTTLPAHVTLFTGEEPTRHGVRHNGVHALSDDATTLTEIVRRRGFATAAFVSSAVLERRYGLAQGFDVYDDEPTEARLELGRQAERSAGETVDRALRWLDARTVDQRFFLWVHLYDPHARYAPPRPYAETWRDRPYLGEIAYMDAELGRLLRHSRLATNALVIAIGDHGESLGEHGEDYHGMLIYDAALRVPWIVRGPGIARGLRVAGPATGVDLLPTTLDLLEVEKPAPSSPNDGRSWASALRGGDGAAPERPIYSETLAPLLSYGWAPLHSVRRGSWKLIDAPAPELYDTASDPGELYNRIDDEKAVARRLGEDLVAIAAEGERAAAAPAAPLDAAQAEKLRSLGYLTAAQPRRAGRVLPDPKTMMGTHRELGEAQEALLRGEPEVAATKLESVLADDPDNVTALEVHGTALLRLGRLDRAEAALDRAIALDPGRTAVVLAAAGLRAQQGKTDQALELATLAATRDARSPEALVAVARYQSALGRDQEAAASARRALDLAPHSAPAEIAYADLVERPAGDLAAAEMRLRRVTGREPLLPEGWLALGSVAESTRGAEAAIAIYEQGLERQPASGQLHAALGMLLAQQQRSGAEEHLRRAADLMRPVPASVERGLALVAIGRRDWKSAESAARRALAVTRDDASAWTLLAAALEEQRRTGDALAAYDAAHRADPRHEPAMFNRALLLRRLRRFADAATQLDQLLTAYPDHPKAHFELGVLYGGPLHDVAASRRHFELAIENGHPDPALVRRLMAELPASGG